MENLKEIDDFIKDEKNAAAFKEFMKTAGYELPEEIEGLKSKNRDLIQKEKTWKEKFAEAQKTLDGIDIDEYNILKNKNSGKDKSGDDVAKLQRDFKKLTDDFQKLSEEKKTTDTKYQTSFKMTELNKALDTNGFDTKHKELLLSAFQGKAVIENENNEDVLLIDGGSLGQLPANEFFKKYAQTEIGKSYLKVPVNTGVGESRMTGGASGKTMTRAAFDVLGESDRRTAVKEKTQIID